MTKININEHFALEVKDIGEGVPIILLHGFCGSSDYWKSTASILSKRFRVLMPDLRGHGHSDAPSGAYTIEQMADDIVDLAEKLSLERFVLLGHSLGGYITLSLAERYSDRLLGFGLVHSTGYPDSEEARANRLKAVEGIQAGGIEAFVDGLVPKLFHPALLSQHSHLIEQALEIGYNTPPQGAIGAALAMRERVDRTAVMSETKQPLLLVAGEGDAVVPQERLFTASGENVMQEVIPGAGHMGMMETPDLMAAAIERFMSEYVAAQ
ncbi:alpha/beta fold hydrolase [Paenibacillus marinisediminis]